MVGYTVNAVHHAAKRYLVLDAVPASITAVLRMTFPSSRCIEAVLTAGRDEAVVWGGLVALVLAVLFSRRKDSTPIGRDRVNAAQPGFK
jgi:hypothetical protein